MQVLIAPDSFTGTLTARQAASAIAEGWARTKPSDRLVLRPMSDGGPGFLDAVEACGGGDRHSLSVTGPLGEPTQGEILLTQASGGPATAWVESALAAGLALIGPKSRDPRRTTSRGVGELIGQAARLGAARVVVGVGGTGTCDGGAGMLAALGARGVGAPMDRGGQPLINLISVDIQPAQLTTSGLELIVATDVDVPLLGARGAARGFAPQKGATADQVEELERALAHFVQLVGPRLDGRHPEVALGAGAGGGMGYALLALDATRVSGVETVMAAADLSGAAAEADLVVTGEGCFDWQSAAGKVVAGVGNCAATAATPAIVLAGRVELARSQWAQLGIDAAYAIKEPNSLPSPPENAFEELAQLAQRVARTWTRT